MAVDELIERLRRIPQPVPVGPVASTKIVVFRNEHKIRIAAMALTATERAMIRKGLVSPGLLYC